MLEVMFPRVKAERRTSPNNFVAANGEQIKHLGEKNIALKTNEGIQRCITFGSASVVKSLSFQCRKLSELETLSCWMQRIRTSEHLRRNDGQAGREQTECTQWACGFASMKQVQFSAGRDSKWSNRFRQACNAGSIV